MSDYLVMDMREVKPKTTHMLTFKCVVRLNAFDRLMVSLITNLLVGERYMIQRWGKKRLVEDRKTWKTE